MHGSESWPGAGFPHLPEIQTWRLLEVRRVHQIQLPATNAPFLDAGRVPAGSGRTRTRVVWWTCDRNPGKARAHHHMAQSTAVEELHTLRRGAGPKQRG